MAEFLAIQPKPKTCGEPSRTIQNRKLVRIVALFVAFTMCGDVAQAQQPKKIPRIGYLSGVDPSTEAAQSEAIGPALRELGYIEGQNIATEYRYMEGKFERAPELGRAGRLKVDIIVVAGGKENSRRPRMRPRRFPSLCGRWARPCRGRPSG